jgi:hypothetical protein
MFLASCVVLAACTAPTRPRADASDSAGIDIIASAAPLWATGHGLVVADTPRAEFLGAGSPDVAVRLPDGRVVVADGAPVRLLYYQADGRPLYEVGRAGDGPAELRSIYHLDVGRADTVALYDLAQRKVMLFDPNGALALGLKIDSSLTPAGSNGYLPRGIAPDGRYLLQRDEVDFPFAGKAGEILADSSRLFWTSRQGTFTDSTVRLLVGELFGLTVRAGRQEFTTPLVRPMAPALRVATGPALVWAGDGSSLEIRGLDATGKVVRIIRAARPRAPLTPALRDTFIARYRARVAGAGNATLPAQFAAGMQTAPFPADFPAFGDLMAGEDSTLWTQQVDHLEGPAGDEGLVWTVFDGAGRWLGDVTMPSKFRPTAVGRGWILGIQGRSGMVPIVRLYPLVER